jgi:NAD+ kinase
MRLRVRVAWESGTSEEALALNDVVVGREALGRMVDLEVRIDGRRAVGYSGDGLIVATATGSTAHALAAGGPLLEPSVGAFVLVPIAPHALATRPLVLPSTHAIEVAIAPGRGGGCVTVDGAPPLPLGPGDRVQVEDARAPLTLVHASGASFYDALRRKLGWRGRPLSAGPAVDEGPREEPGEARRAAGVP